VTLLDRRGTWTPDDRAENQCAAVAFEVPRGVGAFRVELEYERRDGAYRVRPQVFIEGYRPRSHFAGDQKMVTAVNEMRKMTGGMALLNEGVKKVIRPELMRLLDVWSFSTATHHQDLRSAARIALYGMVKTPWMNQVLADLVRDHLEGDTWKVSACS